jgi:IclR family transcriptional regulator, KDG regulon repressor
MPENDHSSRAVERLCTILNVFEDRQPVLTLAEIAAKSGLPKSTTHRMINSLTAHGLIVRDDPALPSYRLGYQLIRWGTLAQDSITLRKIAQPFMRQLVNILNESAVLSICQDSAALWIELVECSQPVRITMRAGVPQPLHAGASSKVLLAFLPEKDGCRYLEQTPLAKLCKNTLTDPQALKNEMRVIRQQGYATSYEETDEGAMGIAAPIFDHQNQLAAGIGIVAPAARILPGQVPGMASRIVSTAHEISRCLGYPIQI